MSVINIMIVVDALATATSGSLVQNVYMVDTEKYLGSWNEGACNLHTLTQSGQFVEWGITGVDPGTDVEIKSFSGALIDQKKCQPQKDTLQNTWKGRIESQPGRFSYTINVGINGKIYGFSPFIEVQ